MIVLLVTDVVLSWMVIQGAYIYLGMVWHGLAKEFLPGTGLAEHSGLAAHGDAVRRVGSSGPP